MVLVGLRFSVIRQEIASLPSKKGKKDPLSWTNPKEGGSDAVLRRAVYGCQTENQIRNTGMMY